MKKKVCAVLLGTALTCHVPLVYGAVQDYQAVTEADKEDNKIFQAFSTEDGSGNSVNVAAIQDTVYVAAKNAGIYSKPGVSSEKMGDVALGDTLEFYLKVGGQLKHSDYFIFTYDKNFFE